MTFRNIAIIRSSAWGMLIGGLRWLKYTLCEAFDAFEPIFLREEKKMFE